MQNVQLPDDSNENDPKYKCCCGSFDVVVSALVSSVESSKLDCALSDGSQSLRGLVYLRQHHRQHLHDVHVQLGDGGPRIRRAGDRRVVHHLRVDERAFLWAFIIVTVRDAHLFANVIAYCSWCCLFSRSDEEQLSFSDNINRLVLCVSVAQQLPLLLRQRTDSTVHRELLRRKGDRS
jgi:hypothetical protein